MNWLESPPDASPIEHLRTAAVNDVLDALNAQSAFHKTSWEAFVVIAQSDGRQLARVDAIVYDARGAPEEMVLSTARLRPSLDRLLMVFEGPQEQHWRIAMISYRRDTREIATEFYYGTDAEPYLMSQAAWDRIAAAVYPKRTTR